VRRRFDVRAAALRAGARFAGDLPAEEDERGEAAGVDGFSMRKASHPLRGPQAGCVGAMTTSRFPEGCVCTHNREQLITTR